MMMKKRAVAALLFLLALLVGQIAARPGVTGIPSKQADSCLGGCPHAHAGPSGITWIPPKPIIT